MEVADVVGGEQSREALLPEVVAAFDLALGLGSGSVKEGNAIEVQGGTQLSESLRGVSEEKGMVINVERQRQAVRGEGAREEIEVSQEIFCRIEAGTDVVAGGIIQDIEEHLFIGLAG